MVDRSHIDEYLVEIRHNGNFDGYFVNSFFPPVVADHDAASDVLALECFLCAPALVNGLVPAVFSQSLLDVPSVAAVADIPDCTLCP